MSARKRIALIHAVTVAMEPIEHAFQDLWPATERMNVLDDTLSVDRAKENALSPATAARISRLADYAFDAGADAILYTCSAFGPAIEAVAQRVTRPVLKPNEAMFEAALARGGMIGMVATFAPSVSSMQAEFNEAAAVLGRKACLATICVPDAMAALRAGDAARHDALVADGARSLRQCDAIMLAQFSMARAADAVSAVTAAPVLTSPRAAVEKLRRALG